EPLPLAVHHTTQPLEGTFLLCVPSGRLIVGGAEDYRSSRPNRVVGESSIVTVPPGDYAVRCHAPDSDADEAEDDYEPSVSEIEAKVLTPEELEYYQEKNVHSLWLVLVGWLLFLAFIPLKSRFGWKLAIPLTLVIAVPYFHWL